MGRISEFKSAFKELDIQNRDLVMAMLTYEDSLILGDVGKNIVTDASLEPRSSLVAVYMIHRLVLKEFGFNTTDESVENYRKIFRHYYRSPTDYDKEVLNCVAYMRQNKCVYYTDPDLTVGDIIPDCRVYDLDGHSSIKTVLNDFDYAFVAGFSLS